VISILIDDDMLLRSYKPEDAAELFRCIDSSREHLRPFLNWVDHTTSIEHSQQFIQMALAQMNSGEGLALGIYLQESRSLIGGIGMHNYLPEQGRAQIGYWIAKAFEGRGLMLRSAHRFVDFLFQKLHLNKIEIHCLPQNIRSLELAHRLGSIEEGRIRMSYLRNGQLEDIVINGILQSEWEAEKLRR
jgi:ribosomal-protein-serine acetyltransferase